MEASEMLTISDGQEFEVDESAAISSETIKYVMDDDCTTDGGIPLAYVDAAGEEEVEKMTTKVQNYSVDKEEERKMAFKELVEANMHILFRFMVVGARSNDESVTNFACKAVDDMIKGLSEEELHYCFGFEKGFSTTEKKLLDCEFGQPGIKVEEVEEEEKHDYEDNDDDCKQEEEVCHENVRPSIAGGDDGENQEEERPLTDDKDENDDGNDYDNLDDEDGGEKEEECVSHYKKPCTDDDRGEEGEEQDWVMIVHDKHKQLGIDVEEDNEILVKHVKKSWFNEDKEMQAKTLNTLRILRPVKMMMMRRRRWWW